jgi:hypothetical protein
MADMLNCLSRYYKCRDDIAKMPNGKEKIDLQKMYNSLGSVQKDVNNFWIECRRLRRVTAQYETSVENFDSLLTNLEQYITLAYLTKG